MSNNEITGGIADPGEFWNALGRLYDSTVKLQEAAEHLHGVALTHERRLDRIEVVVDGAIIGELREIRKEIMELKAAITGRKQ